MSLEIHPLAELIPPMTDGEFAELRADIQEHGLLDPITLYEGKVLDGRHRLRACEETGRSEGFEDYEGDDPAGFVISKNLHRRHLTNGQRALAATGLLEYETKRAKERMLSGKADPMQNSAQGPATAEAGKKLGVSRDSVEKARAVKAARPDLAEKVAAGEITLNAAVEQQRGRSTNGREQKSQPIDYSAGRNRQIAAKSKERIERVVGTCGGLSRGIPELNVEAALAVATPEEVKGWLESFKDASSAIKQLRKRLEEAS